MYSHMCVCYFIFIGTDCLSFVTAKSLNISVKLINMNSFCLFNIISHKESYPAPNGLKPHT